MTRKQKFRKVPISAFSQLRAALDAGTNVFADLRPPRYCRHKMAWIVAQHDGKETIEHTFDTQGEADGFFNDHQTTQKELTP